MKQANLHTMKMARKCPCNANKDIAQLIVNQKQRKGEIAATLVFVCTGY